MRAIYITINDLERASDGVSKKCIDQINALRSLGFAVSVFYLRQNVLIFNGAGCESREIPLRQKYLFLPRVSAELENLGASDLVFIRNPHGGLHSAFLTKILRSADMTGGKVVLDIPHFPYDAEAKTLGHRISIILHKMNRPFLRPYIDLVSYTGELKDNVWGLPCIRIFNALDFSRITPKPACSFNPSKDSVIFLGVAHLAHWHGYDRLIKGIHAHLAKERSSRHVHFTIVGDGHPELERLQQLVDDLDLHEHVSFTGKLSGRELDFQYEQADIGVDSLGRHRSGNNYNCSIKSKEFAARGIPFIKSHQDDAFIDAPFVLTVVANEDPIDIQTALDWFQNCPVSATDISEQARNFLTWEIQMKKIVDRLGIIGP